MARFTFLDLLLSQWAPLPPPLSADLKGKMVVVIGANTGIGFEAVKHFARMKPARMVIGCRSEEKGRKAAEAIAAETGFAVELELIDLANFSSISDFAIRLGNAPVDILVMNAAVAEVRYSKTADDWETTLQVNYLAPALLALLLTPNLVRAGKEHNSNSRLVVVTSEMHHNARLDKVLSAPHVLRALNDEAYASEPENLACRYADSKALSILFTRAFASKLGASAPVIATAVNPGYCMSGLRRNFPLRTQVTFKIMDWTMGRTAEAGARQLIWAALGPDGKHGPHEHHLQGAYVNNAMVIEPSDFVITKEGYEARERVWDESLQVLIRVSPGVETIVKGFF